MKVEKFTTTPADIEITGATLLSLEEYKEYKNNIPLAKNWWWLRSPGCRSDLVAVVFNDDIYGEDVSYVRHDIRPALQISNLGDVDVGDKIKFDGKFFTVISPEYALCDTIIRRDSFRKGSHAKDTNSYKASDVKKVVDEWFANAVKAAENVT